MPLSLPDLERIINGLSGLLQEVRYFVLHWYETTKLITIFTIFAVIIAMVIWGRTLNIYVWTVVLILLLLILMGARRRLSEEDERVKRIRQTKKYHKK